MSLDIPEPELYVLPPTAPAPNSPMPVLVCRDVLPTPRTKEVAREFIESPMDGPDRQVLGPL